MKRTNKEFYAEVCRRKSAILRARKVRNKRIFTAILCLPFCYMALMLAIAMQPAGSASPNGNSDKGMSFEEIVITEDDVRGEAVCAFFAEITAHEPENAAFDWDLNKSFSHKVIFTAEGKTYYLNNMYVFDGANTFAITSEEYRNFCDIIIRKGGEFYEK